MPHSLRSAKVQTIMKLNNLLSSSKNRKTQHCPFCCVTILSAIKNLIMIYCWTRQIWGEIISRSLMGKIQSATWRDNSSLLHTLIQGCALHSHPRVQPVSASLWFLCQPCGALPGMSASVKEGPAGMNIFLSKKQNIPHKAAKTILHTT